MPEIKNQEEMFIIENLPIFRTGKWNGDEYNENDLDEIVKSFEKIGKELKPFLKLGHDKEQALIQKDGLPAAGWIAELKRKGQVLYAKIINVPKKIKELIDNRAYGRVSAELFWNLKEGDKTYPRVLKAVALLGADTPAIGTLDDFINLYTENKVDNKIYILDKKEFEKMDTQEIKTFEKEFADARFQLKEYEIEIEKLKKENLEFSSKMAAKEAEIKEKEINNYLDSAIKEGKLEPAQRETFFNIAKNQFEDVKKIIDAMPIKKEFSQNSEAVKSDKVPASDGELSEFIDKKAKEYILKNNMQDNRNNYRIAVSEVIKEVKHV